MNKTTVSQLLEQLDADWLADRGTNVPITLRLNRRQHSNGHVIAQDLTITHVHFHKTWGVLIVECEQP